MKKSNVKNLKSKFVNKYLGGVTTIENIRNTIMQDSISVKLVGEKDQCIAAGIYVEDDMIHFVKQSEINNQNAKSIVIRYEILKSSYGDEGVQCAECRECQMLLLSEAVITSIEFINMN